MSAKKIKEVSQKETTYKSSFTVFPQDTNYNVPPCIFGGKMLAEMDNAAAMVTRRALYGTVCTDAVTVQVTDVVFSRPAYLGEIVQITAWLTNVGTKSMDIAVRCLRESREGKLEEMASGKFRFVARKDGNPHPHGLQMPDVIE